MHKDIVILLVSTLIIGLCGLLYELLIGAAASYLLGSSVLQFSLTIGAFMTAFGVGSFLSQYLKANIIQTFLWIETAIGLLGSVCILALFYFYAVSELVHLVMYFFIVAIGLLVGLEIPLIGRLIDLSHKDIRLTLASLLSFDYIGAMIGSLLLPLVLLPNLGLIRTSILVGMGNLFVSVLVGFRFRSQVSRVVWLLPLFFILVDGVLFWKAGNIQHYIEQKYYDDEVIHTQQSRYQRIVLTKDTGDLRLYLNGNLQFSSRDEYRYHEVMVHLPVAMRLRHPPTRVLILGGGDGLAARELLRYPSIQKITICDIDPALTALARKHPLMLRVNQRSLHDPRVQIVHQDAFMFLEQVYRQNKRRKGARALRKWDLILIDLPDPNNESLAKLYTVKFYKLIARALFPHGLAITQATSPFHARKVFWCIVHTIQTSGFAHILPMSVDVPAFGLWGFVAFAPQPLAIPKKLPFADSSFRYLNASIIPSFFQFPRDMDKIPTQANTVFRAVILTYYENAWKRY